MQPVLHPAPTAGAAKTKGDITMEQIKQEPGEVLVKSEEEEEGPQEEGEGDGEKDAQDQQPDEAQQEEAEPEVAVGVTQEEVEPDVMSVSSGYPEEWRGGDWAAPAAERERAGARGGDWGRRLRAGRPCGRCRGLPTAG